jgi:hypothetical protein
MSYFVAGILRITILEASVALLVIARLLQRADVRAQRRLDFAFRALAVLALFSWTNYGSLRGDGGLVHRWEQYHFFFGSKYLPEIGYFNLYKATILADRESVHALDGVRVTRDLTTFDEVGVDTALGDAATVRAAFSDERWRAFVADWRSFGSEPADWVHVMADHGNSGSPAWAIFAAPIARLAGSSPTGQQLMGLVDSLLMIILFLFVFATFGTRPACLMIIVWSMVPFCFDYLAGSLLRWDWLFALGMCLCLWRRGRPLGAGLFAGYAVASKLFPLFFALGLLFHSGWTFLRTRRLDRRLVRFAVGAAAALALAVLLSSAMFGGLRVWRGYQQRIGVAQHEKFYSNQYSLRTVFLQIAESRGDEYARDWMLPPRIKLSLPWVDIEPHRTSFLLIQLTLTALVALALAGADEVEALAVGPFLVYVWLVVNAYYWNMLALTALAWAARELTGERDRLIPLIGLHALLAWFYLYQHLNHGYAEGYFVGLLLLVLLVAWAVTTLWRLRGSVGREAQRSSSR